MITAARTTPTADHTITRPPRGSIAVVLAGSLAAGLLAALLLVAAPFIPAEEGAVTGAVLCGFALGWALLTVLSVQLTDQPQRWSVAPALFMGVSGLLLLAFGSPVRDVLDRVWPPALLALVVWMIIGARRQLRSRSRLLLYPLLAVLALASIGGEYQTVAAAADAKAFKMPGQLIDVGGHRLHLSCTGSGSPTVVLEPGAGLTSSALAWIAPTLAGDTRVCVYDRAGRGWSEPSDAPQDGAQIATDLHALLQRGDVPGPYVLAGHSFGGLYVLTFAAHYPDEVAGMVLVDSTAPAPAAAPDPRSPDAGSYHAMNRVAALVSTSARLGLGRLYSLTDYATLPPRHRDEARAGGATASQLRSTIDEYLQGGASAREAASLRAFTKPLVVLTAGSGSAAGWSQKQDALATLSTNSAHRVIAGATHASLILDEEDAASTTQAIVDVVSSVRSSVPLGR